MADDPRIVAGEGHPRLPIPLWPFLLICSFFVVAAGVILCRGRAEIQVPAKALPAYHRIVSTDLHAKKVRSQGLDDSVLRKTADLEGRVTRQAIGENKPIHEDAVTSVVDANAYAGVQLDLQPERSSAQGVQPGDLVALRLAPTADNPDIRGATVNALLLDASETDGGKKEYVVVVGVADIDTLLNLLGRAELLITPR